MAQPVPYDRQANFSDIQAQNPTSPLPAQDVDAEYNAIKITSDQTLANLAKIQRDDGALRNGIVTQDSLSTSLSIGFTFRGDWTVGVNYIVGDGVSLNSKFYIAKVSNLSSALNSPAVDSVTWNLATDFTAATAEAVAARDAALAAQVGAELAEDAARAEAVSAAQQAGVATQRAAETAADAAATAADRVATGQDRVATGQDRAAAQGFRNEAEEFAEEAEASADRAATWDPTKYAPLTGAAFTGITGVNNGTGGQIWLTPGSTTNTGYISFHTLDGVRRGYIGHGNAATKQLEIAGESGWTWQFNTRPMFAGNTPWDSGNFDPNTKANTASPTFTGGVNITGGLAVGVGADNSLITMYDSNEGNRAIHNNSGRIGFLGSNGSWILQVSDAGEIWCSQLGDIHNRIENRANVYQQSARDWAYANLIRDVALGGPSTQTSGSGTTTPQYSGHVVVATDFFDQSRRNTVVIRAVQKNVNGVWYAVGHTA